MITIHGEMMDMNTFQNKTRTNKFIGAKIKKEETERVYWECKQQKVSPVTEYPVHISFIWYVKNNKKDPDNISFAKKFCLDGLVEAGVLQGDGRKFINGFTDEFETSDNPRVEIIII